MKILSLSAVSAALAGAAFAPVMFYEHHYVVGGVIASGVVICLVGWILADREDRIRRDANLLIIEAEDELKARS
ncbi:hypothetical protein [Tsukamurella soli]|uniref:Uncharacterized protein n=1 Tax=Tsukamurella soli TaxID=644556 RepID=A0ABP8JIS8_9ACTN